MNKETAIDFLNEVGLSCHRSHNDRTLYSIRYDASDLRTDSMTYEEAVIMTVELNTVKKFADKLEQFFTSEGWRPNYNTYNKYTLYSGNLPCIKTYCEKLDNYKNFLAKYSLLS